jgi:hypothetical protein
MMNKWVLVSLFMLGTALSWGVYVPLVHTAAMKFGSNLRAFLLVGVAYFLVAVLIPTFMVFALNFDPTLKTSVVPNFSADSIKWGLMAGTAGALGALFVILATNTAGKVGPLIVPPIIFAGAPIVNTLVTILYFHPVKATPDWRFFLGLGLAVGGAVLVMLYKPVDNPAVPGNPGQHTHAAPATPTGTPPNSGSHS